VGRKAFRSAAEGSACGRELRSLFGFASREMSLWSPDRNLKTAATEFKAATKGPRDPSTSEASARGTYRSCVRSHKRTGPICPLRWAKVGSRLRKVGIASREGLGPIRSGAGGRDRCWRLPSFQGRSGFLFASLHSNARPCFVYGFLVGMMYSWHAAITAQGLLIGCEWVGYRIEEWLQCRGLGKEEE
jgi:hypothetical protein